MTMMSFSKKKRRKLVKGSISRNQATVALTKILRLRRCRFDRAPPVLHFKKSFSNFRSYGMDFPSEMAQIRWVYERTYSFILTCIQISVL